MWSGYFSRMRIHYWETTDLSVMSIPSTTCMSITPVHWCAQVQGLPGGALRRQRHTGHPRRAQVCSM